MTREIEIQKRCICLRNGNEIWVNEDTYQKMRIAREKANGHILIYVTELDREVNTADIVEICTADQMDDRSRILAGEKKCLYGNWHNRKERCNCLSEKLKKQKKKNKERQNKPLTPEQIKNRNIIMDETKKILQKKGIIGTTRKCKETKKDFSKNIQHSKDGKCVVCGNNLENGLANVCSGDCFREKKENPEKYKNKLI